MDYWRLDWARLQGWVVIQEQQREPQGMSCTAPSDADTPNTSATLKIMRAGEKKNASKT